MRGIEVKVFESMSPPRARASKNFKDVVTWIINQIK